MKLGDKIKLHIEKEKTFGGEPEIIDGEFTVIELGSSLPHCFSKDCWSGGFTHFAYGKYEEGKPDIVLQGSIYLPSTEMLDKEVMEKLHWDKKTVSWEIIKETPDYAKGTMLDKEVLADSLDKLTIRKTN